MRSNIESAFSMVKGKFGDSVRSKSDTGQVNEALCKVLPQHLRAHSCDARPQHRAGIFRHAKARGKTDEGLGETPIQEGRSLVAFYVSLNAELYPRHGMKRLVALRVGERHVLADVVAGGQLAYSEL